MPEGDNPSLRLGRYVINYSLIALAALVLCTSSLVLAMRYSRSREVGGPPPPRAARFSPFSPCSPSRATCSCRAPC